MEVQHTHPMSELFQQLGMPDSDEAIEKFIATHRLKHDDGELYRAIFWSPAQAKFIKEAVELDADWAETVDELDARLRR